MPCKHKFEASSQNNNSRKVALRPHKITVLLKRPFGKGRPRPSHEMPKQFIHEIGCIGNLATCHQSSGQIRLAHSWVLIQMPSIDGCLIWLQQVEIDSLFSFQYLYVLS